jgi:Bax protein
MRPLHSKTLATVILLAAIALIALPLWRSWQAQPPDFTLLPAGETRKQAFFSYLGPLIDGENRRWRLDRKRLDRLAGALVSGKTLGKRDLLWLEAKVAFFDVGRDQPIGDRIDDLRLHVDEVPRSLALAQAAKESAWGTSRFAIDAHNYFGQRCYNKGCGLVPESRASGAKFEVRLFDSVQASVESYMNNINSHSEYEGFRAYRARQRAASQPLNGIQAAEQLSQYSERRQDYVDEIQSLIHFNLLDSPIDISTEVDTARDATLSPPVEANPETITL